MDVWKGAFPKFAEGLVFQSTVYRSFKRRLVLPKTPGIFASKAPHHPGLAQVAAIALSLLTPVPAGFVSVQCAAVQR